MNNLSVTAREMTTGETYSVRVSHTNEIRNSANLL